MIAYLLNIYFVFNVNNTLKMGLAVIAGYGVQYVYGLLTLSVLVDAMAMKAWLAMIVVMVTAVPLQFLVLRFVARTIPQRTR